MRNNFYTTNRIPSFMLAHHYVYFNDLLFKNQYVSDNGQARKEKLHAAAQAEADKGIYLLRDTDEANTAIQNARAFISKIAYSERQKEIAFAKHVMKEFPEFVKPGMSSLDPEDINNDPLKFYTTLTSMINQGRQTTEQYRDALLRLKDNVKFDSIANSGEYAKDNRSGYSQDDFIYNLNSEITSFINQLIGRGHGRADGSSDDPFAARMREAVIKIMQSKKIATRLSSGEDFVAIAASIYGDLYTQVQQEYNEMRRTGNNLSNLTEVDLAKITDKYIKMVKSQNRDKMTTVQKALNNVRGADFKLITSNAISLLGIKTIKDQKEITKQLEQIQKVDEEWFSLEGKGRVIDKINRINIQQMLKQRAAKLENQVNKITIKKFDEKTAQGNFAEFITGLSNDILNGRGRTFGVGASGDATDMVSFVLNIDVASPSIDAYTKTLLEGLKKIYKEEGVENNKGYAHRKKFQEQRTKRIQTLNSTIDEILKRLDAQLAYNPENKLQHMFIFHESLKEYSSIETGKSKQFHGSNLNILSAWDQVYAALQGAGLDEPMDKDLITLLSLNLADKGGDPKDPAGNTGAVASMAYDPLIRYLSLFAGLILFDDTMNIANEAYSDAATYSNITQLHVYKLNRIYVPASMLLFHIERAINECSSYILSEAAAKVDIDIKAANAAITEWIAKRQKPARAKDGRVTFYHIDNWRETASDVASGTKVKITFLASFLKFIEQLLLQDQP